MWIELSADGAAKRLHLLDERPAAERGPSDQIRMTADIFGQGIEGNVCAVLDRALKDRAEQRVIAGDHRLMALLLTNRIGNPPDHRDVDKAIGRVCGRLDEDDRDAALAIASSAAALTEISLTPSAKPTAETPKLRKVFASNVSVPP